MTTPLPSPPFHLIPNINNLRDVALYPLHTPFGPLRPGLLFRSADVSHLDGSGWAAVRELGISRVFDLRSHPEVVKGKGGRAGDSDEASEQYADRGGEPMAAWMKTMQQAGVQRTWTPVFAASDYSPERLAGRYIMYMDQSVTGFVHAYHDILRNAGPAYRTILCHLAALNADQVVAGRGNAILVHCTAGKDRTGIFFGVLLDFLGVRRDDIAAEYHLTEDGLRHVRDEVVARLMQSAGFRQYMAALQAGRPLSKEEIGKVLGKDGQGQEEAQEGLSAEVLEMGRQAALRMIGAKRESMLGALEMVDREWGSAEGYMRTECGLGDAELESLRRNLVRRE